MRSVTDRKESKSPVERRRKLEVEEVEEVEEVDVDGGPERRIPC